MGLGFAVFFQQLPGFIDVLLRAAVMTIVVTLCASLMATFFGIVFLFPRLSASRPLRAVAIAYVELARATPMLTLLFIIYFGMPQLGIRLDSLSAAVIAFGIHGGGYLVEIFRSAIEAINKGQLEAGLAIGMTRFQALRVIVLPQAARIGLPPYCNYAIQLLKDSSLASTISVPELMMQTRLTANATYLTIELYVFVALIYLVMSLPLSYGALWLQTKLSARHRTP